MESQDESTVLDGLSLAQEGKVFDLSHSLSPGMPVLGFHVPYFMTLQNRHGDNERPGNTSYANEVIVLSAHTGTHVDALGHISRGGRLHGGDEVTKQQTAAGLLARDAASIPAVLRRGVLLDVLAHEAEGTQHLPAGFPIDAEHLDRAAGGVKVMPGDVVLIRTGWSRLWSEAERFVGADGGYPGVSPNGAKWLLEHSPHMVGADTPTFEVAPTLGESVHGMMLVDHGVHIIENLYLEALAGAGYSEFLFVMLPLKMIGATGSPVRPVAVV